KAELFHWKGVFLFFLCNSKHIFTKVKTNHFSIRSGFFCKRKRPVASTTAYIQCTFSIFYLHMLHNIFSPRLMPMKRNDRIHGVIIAIYLFKYVMDTFFLGILHHSSFFPNIVDVVAKLPFSFPTIRSRISL